MPDIGVGGTAIVGVIYYILPVGVWYVGALRSGLARRTFDLLCKAGRFRLMPQRPEYEILAVPPVTVGRAIRRVVGRALQLLLAILGGAAVFTDYVIDLSGGPNVVSRPGMLVFFVGFTVLASTLLFFIFVPAWVYDDIGLRRRDVSRATLSVPFETPRRLAVYGGIITLARFSLTLAGNPLAAVSFVVAAATLSIPLDLLLLALFYNMLRPKAMSDLMKCMGETRRNYRPLLDSIGVFMINFNNPADKESSARKLTSIITPSPAEG